MKVTILRPVGNILSPLSNFGGNSFTSITSNRGFFHYGLSLTTQRTNRDLSKSFGVLLLFRQTHNFRITFYRKKFSFIENNNNVSFSVIMVKYYTNDRNYLLYFVFHYLLIISINSRTLPFI